MQSSIRKLVLFVLLITAITPAQEMKMQNPLLSEWKTEFQTPPFDLIKSEHFLPAYEEGMNQQKREVEAIVNNNEKPTFTNTIEAFEKSGKIFIRVNNVFNCLTGASTNDALQGIYMKVAPLIAKHYDDIYLNGKFFERVKSIYAEKDQLHLTTEQKVVLELYYRDFLRGGANLSGEKKEIFRLINEKLSLLGVKFGENILKESNSIGLILDKHEDLDGLPEGVVQGAAKAKGLNGKWAFTLQRPSWTPFLQYSTRRDLREKLFKAYLNRGNNGDQFDTKNIIREIISLRVERANLLGYKTHADFKLEINMARNPDNVYKFLNDLWTPSLKKAGTEAAALQKMIDDEGDNFKLQPCDWWYYAEKVKNDKYALNEEMLRPYFKIENVIAGAFGVATKLFGLIFVERKNIQVYHPDVKVFEVKETDGKHVGILYTDYFPRDGKRSGAWMSELTGIMFHR